MRTATTHVEVAAALVTHQEFARFVTTESYFNSRFWDADARRSEFWRRRVALPQWGGDEVLCRVGFRWEEQRRPVLGVTWYEADAYSRFVGGRLPWRHELLERRRELGVGAEAAEWCGNWYNPHSDEPHALPEPPPRKRAEGWAGVECFMPDLVGECIGFRVVHDKSARGL